jgi:hypothetical protein
MARGRHIEVRHGPGRVSTGIVGLVAGMLLAISIPVMATSHEVTPSTNDANRDNGWAHFNVLAERRGEVDIEFVSTRTFFSCFEYRSDGAPPPDDSPNFNTDITDGLWSYVCVNNSTATRSLTADEYVEIRMVFGAERDERFDWTRVDVLEPLAKDDCKNGGYEDEGFFNQGRCVASVQANERAHERGPVDGQERAAERANPKAGK